MNQLYSKLFVYFEDPFWVGIFEKREEDQLSVCKVTFGPEPKDYEVLEFVQNHLYQLRFSPAITTDTPITKAEQKNPKRMQRDARKEIAKGIGTKSQQALKAQHEQSKEIRSKRRKEEKEEELQLKFELKQQKKKEKKKGH